MAPTPLSPPLFDLLVGLADGPQHGYGLMLRIEHMHQGAYRPSPGVVYSNLQRGIDAGWVEEVATAEDADGRRRCYQLTQSGADAAAAHATDLKRSANHALAALRGRVSC